MQASSARPRCAATPRVPSSVRPQSHNIIYPPKIRDQVRKVGEVVFPKITGINCNMMPFVMGDINSLPKPYRLYAPLIDACKLPESEIGQVGFLSISESLVKIGHSQRRGGAHTEKHPDAQWGGWGSKAGLYMASTVDKSCRIWNCHVTKPGPMGDCGHLRGLFDYEIIMEKNTLYWLTDSAPHEALTQIFEDYRQWFRLVTKDVGKWYFDHSTANPLVGLPKNIKIIYGNKFAK